MLKWSRSADKPVAGMNGLSLRRPWARPDATTPTQAGGFFTVLNAGPGDRLVSAASPLAERVEIHAIRVVGADIRMQALPEGLRIPADTTIELKPRGYHLLLIGLKERLPAGESLPVTLTFEAAGRLEIGLIVEQPGLVGLDILDEERHRL